MRRQKSIQKYSNAENLFRATLTWNMIGKICYWYFFSCDPLTWDQRLVWTIGIAVISNLRLSLRFWKKLFSFHDLNGCRYIFSFWLFILAGFIMRQQFRTHQLTRMEILLLQSSWMKQRGKNTKQNLGRLINGLFPVCKSFNWKKARKNSTMALNR